MVGVGERLGNGTERPLGDGRRAGRVGLEVAGPVRVDSARGDDDRAGMAARVVRIANGDDAWGARCTTDRHEANVPATGDEIVIERAAAEVRQRLRCQDLPSVWVDGA